jgi:hypothetical protein
MGTADDGTSAALPFVDEHRVVVAAPAPAVWRALGASLPRDGLVEKVSARLLATQPGRAHGDPLHAGSAIPGFGIAEAVPGERLVLAGRHRFSDYRLTFSLASHDGGTEVTARTDARFPGLGGRAYRALVIGSGGHAVLVRRWLRGIGRLAERA